MIKLVMIICRILWQVEILMTRMILWMIQRLIKPSQQMRKKINISRSSRVSNTFTG